EDRAAYVKSELVEPEWGRAAGLVHIRTQVARPAIGVQRRIPEILDQVAVEILRAALGHKPNLPRRGAPVLGVIVRSQNLHFLNTIYVLRAQHGSGGAGPRGDRSVHHHDILVRAAAVDTEAAIGDAVGVERADTAAPHTGLEQRQVNGIAAVQ